MQDAGARADAANAFAAALDGSSGAPKLKSVKERVAFARAVGAFATDAGDMVALSAITGDVASSAMRVVQRLAAYQAAEPAVEGRVAVAGATEAWLALAGAVHVHALANGRANGDGKPKFTTPAVPSEVATMIAAGLADKAPEVRSGTVRIAVAAATVLGSGAALVPALPQLLALAREGEAKAAMRGDGALALAAALAIADADASSGAEVWELVNGPELELLAPRVLAGRPRVSLMSCVPMW